jgi:uncharacterized membrane protein YkvA (DUF1232 family)
MVEWLIGIGIGLLLAWGALIVVLLASRPHAAHLDEAIRLLPDTLRLLHALAADPVVPRGAKMRLWLLFVYLAIPIDIVPDFIPVAGQLDDAIVVALVLRVVVGGWGPLRLLLWPERRTTSPDLRSPAAPTSSASTS